MPSLDVPFVPAPTPEQREAMRVTSEYLARSYSQVGTRLLTSDPWEPNTAMLDDICSGLRQAASLIDSLVDAGER